jgi:hypothetical protein
LIADGAGRVIKNTTNDPNFILTYVANFQTVFGRNAQSDIHIYPPRGTEPRIESSQRSLEGIRSHADSLKGSTPGGC